MACACNTCDDYIRSEYVKIYCFVSTPCRFSEASGEEGQHCDSALNTHSLLLSGGSNPVAGGKRRISDVSMEFLTIWYIQKPIQHKLNATDDRVHAILFQWTVMATCYPTCRISFGMLRVAKELFWSPHSLKCGLLCLLFIGCLPCLICLDCTLDSTVHILGSSFLDIYIGCVLSGLLEALGHLFATFSVF